MKVLAAARDAAFLEGLRRAGAEVVTTLTIDDAREAIAREEPSCLVLDEGLPEAQELVVFVRSEVDGPDRDRLPVVSRLGAPERPPVRCVPDLEVARDEAPAQFVAAAKAIVLRRARQRRLFDQEVVLEVRTTPDAVEQTGDIYERLVAAAGYDEPTQVRMAHTFREAMGNAAEHGNKNQPDRLIRVAYLRAADRVTTVIQDEGPGFDTKAFLARAGEVSPLEHTRSRRDVESRPGGLGVFIMKETCDSIEFNGSGNAIFLTKFLPGHAPPIGIG